MEELDYYYCSNAAAVNQRSSGGGGHIPSFGNWDFTNDLPITQYFECARQAGLVRYSSSSGECYPRAAADLYAVGVDPVQKPEGGRGAAFNTSSASRKANEQRRAHVKEQKKGGRICDVTQQPPKTCHVSKNKCNLQSDDVPYPRPQITNKPPKAMDEDLYQIPPELLNQKKKKKLGFISRCLVPACAA